MATTTKTLGPTNQTVTLPDMTEKPNASVLVDGIGKEADAINVLNGKRFDTISDTTKTDMTLAFLNSVRSGMTDGQIAMVRVSNFSGIAYRYTTDYMQILAFSYSDFGTVTIYTYVTGTWRKREANMGTATVISQ